MRELNKLISEEGNYCEWVNTIKCFIQRNDLGSWCGYVVIPKSYPAFDEEYIKCHGGVTYHALNNDGDMVIGFDCAHSGDLIPSLTKINYELFGDSYYEYRDKQYVIDEVNSMVKQILNKKEIKRHLKINNILND